MAGLGLALMMGANGVAQSQSMEAQGDYQRQQAELNASLSDMQAKDAIKRGDEEAVAHKKKVKQVIGSQRASMAAQGIDIGDGSALQIQEDTAAIGAEDTMTIKNNAWREAWGHRVSAADQRGQGRMAQMGARNQARNTLITGITSGAGYYYGKKGT